MSDTNKTFRYDGIVYDLDAIYVDNDGDRWGFTGRLPCGMPTMGEWFEGRVLRLTPSGKIQRLSFVVGAWGPLVRVDQVTDDNDPYCAECNSRHVRIPTAFDTTEEDGD